jgi:hypothetical protein
MRRILGFAAGCVGFIVVVMFIVWAMGAFEDINLGTQGWIAFTLGVVLTCALGIGLMALVFYSDRSGQDERVGGGPGAAAGPVGQVSGPADRRRADR